MLETATGWAQLGADIVQAGAFAYTSNYSPDRAYEIYGASSNASV